jgi:hypothetical protein
MAGMISQSYGGVANKRCKQRCHKRTLSIRLLAKDAGILSEIESLQQSIPHQRQNSAKVGTWHREINISNRLPLRRSTMSRRNGDKSRFNRQRKQKIARRKQAHQLAEQAKSRAAGTKRPSHGMQL